MIALRHALPLIRGTQGNAVAFESAWLRAAIQAAASQAGYHGWWQVDELVAGIALYLRNCYVKNVIDLSELEAVVRGALCDIGYEEVAACFRGIPPSRGISLVQCLQNTPLLNRFTFFDHLAETISLLYEKKVRHFHFYDLHACVDEWKNEADAGRLPRHERVRETIVTFVRQHVHSQDWAHQVWCSIS